jgi:hypothetical protein
MSIATLEFYVMTSLIADAIKGVIDTLRLGKVWVQALFKVLK